MSGPGPFAVALAVIYLLAGLAFAVAVAVARRRTGWEAAADLALTVLLWPLYGPLLLAARATPGVGALDDDRERALLRALRRVEGTPLGALLPDRHAVRALSHSLRHAGARLAEIDAVLARPEMSEEAALERLALTEQPAAGPDRRAAALLRVQGIRRLRGTRERFARHLREVDDLLDQLAAQAELVRFLGAAEAPGADLVRELVTRVEALGQMLDDAPDAGGGVA